MYRPAEHRELITHRRDLATRGVIAMDGPMALDAQPQLTGTVANSGIPVVYSTFVDRDILKVVFTPMKIAAIWGEEPRKIGDWTKKTAMFPVVEYTGDVSAYDDYSADGSAGFNADFPQRQSYHFQTIINYGERETDLVGETGINLVGEKKAGAMLALNKFRNRMFAFGIGNLQNYGILNDPGLPASIQPGPKAYNSQAHGPWITNGVFTAQPTEVFADIQALFYQLVIQSGSVVEIDQSVPLVLVMSPQTEVALTSVNSFGIVAWDLIKRAFPNMEVKTAQEYATAAGNVVQLIAKEVEGQKTGFAAVTEMLRTHRLVIDLSSFRMKLSAGGWGTINRQLWAYASMLGV